MRRVAHLNDQHPGLGRRGLDEHDLHVGAGPASNRPASGPPSSCAKAKPRASSSRSSCPRWGVNATRSRSLRGLVQRPARKSTATPPLNHIGDATLLSVRRTARISAGWMATPHPAPRLALMRSCRCRLHAQPSSVGVKSQAQSPSRCRAGRTAPGGRSPRVRPPRRPGLGPLGDEVERAVDRRQTRRHGRQRSPSRISARRSAAVSSG